MKNNYKKIIKKSNEIYDDVAKKYPGDGRAVLWNDPQSQYYRFYELVKNLDLNSTNKSILDIGCGNCELYKFLNFIGFRGTYTGYDINDKLLKQAKRRFKNINVYNIDILSQKKHSKFDYVLMSGLFNVDVGQDNDFIYSFIKLMFSYCRVAVIFNAISTHVNYRDKNLYYLDPAELLTYCIENITSRVTISHHNLPFNFTITLYKFPNWISINKKGK